MSIIQSNMTASPATAAGGSGGALSSISEMNSLRFDGSSYLERTATTTSSYWTISFWFKLATDYSDYSYFWSQQARGIALGDIDSSIPYKIYFWDGSSSNLEAPPLIRDQSAWYHFTMSVHGNNGSIIYINGVSVATGAHKCVIGSAMTMNFGRYYDGRFPYKGYLANIHLIDGTIVDANAFGQEISGVWVPKAYDPATSGAYGINGFHLDFATSNMDWTNGKVLDASGNGNDWNIN